MEYVNQQCVNPLSEEDIMDLIKDNKISDKSMLNIIRKLTEKWGRKNTITPNIRDKLVCRKKLLDPFFTKMLVDEKSELQFKNKNGEPLVRHITYCHDIPGLLAYKKILEKDYDSEGIHVVGIDDGKSLLKIVYNWSCLGRQEGKEKLTGPKRSLVLAAVNVPETHWNIHVLMELTKLNEIDFRLSQDLKLINIVIGITSHSSKFPCPYGECFKDEENEHWIKGKNRTFSNLQENQKKWCDASKSKKGNRKNLKEFKNCEFPPLVTVPDPDTPVLFIIPPPPLHLILLGRAAQMSGFH